MVRVDPVAQRLLLLLVRRSTPAQLKAEVDGAWLSGPPSVMAHHVLGLSHTRLGDAGKKRAQQVLRAAERIEGSGLERLLGLLRLCRDAEDLHASRSLLRTLAAESKASAHLPASENAEVGRPLLAMRL